MYTDYTADFVAETSSCFVKNACKVFEEVAERCEALESFYLAMIDNCFNDELLQSTEKLIDTEYQKEESFITNVDQNKLTIENLESTVLKLKVLRAKKESEFSSLEQRVTAVRDRIHLVCEELENLNKKKDQILTYKLLTNVDFLFSTKKVTGLVNKQLPKTFSLNPQELSQEEITNELWELILQE